MDKFFDIVLKIINKPFHLIGFGTAFCIAGYLGKLVLAIGFIAIGLGIGEIAERICSFIKNQLEKYKYEKLMYKRLLSLNEQEVVFIKQAFEKESQTMYLQEQKDTSTMLGLHNKGIVAINGFGGEEDIAELNLSYYTPITITDLAWELVKRNNKKIFGGSNA